MSSTLGLHLVHLLRLRLCSFRRFAKKLGEESLAFEMRHTPRFA
jgi:hypothetical protein